MGGGASRVGVAPVCPPGYDESKFRNLLKLFDAYDTDGSMTLGSGDDKELSRLATAIVASKVDELNKQYSDTMKFIGKEDADRRAQFERDMQAWHKRMDASMESIVSKRTHFERMSDHQKVLVLLSEMGASDGEHITWAKFFEYMRPRY